MKKRTYSELRKRILFWKRLSLGLSILMHPLLMPTALFAILVFFAPTMFNPASYSARLSLLWFIIVSTFVLPFFLLLLQTLFRKKRIQLSDLLLDDRKKRVAPMMFVGMFYTGLTVIIFTQLKLHGLIFVFLAVISMNVLLVAFVSLFYKISAHAVGIAGLLGFLIGVNIRYSGLQLFYPILVVAFVTGLVMSARMNLQAHRPAQVWAGAAMGFIICLGAVLIFATPG